MPTHAALRAVAQAAFNLQRLCSDDLTRIRNIAMVRGYRKPAGRDGKIGERDAAIIGLLYICGLLGANTPW